MPSEDAPPVADAHVGTHLNLLDSVDAGVDNFVENYDLMGGEGGIFEKYSLSDQMVHFCGGVISRVHWTACKAVLAFHAGSSVTKLSQMTKKLREASCLRIYMNAVDELNDEHFDADAKGFFKSSFLDQRTTASGILVSLLLGLSLQDSKPHAPSVSEGPCEVEKWPWFPRNMQQGIHHCIPA